MRTFLLFIALTAFFASNQATARPYHKCPKFENPKVTITLLSAKPTINHENDLSGIRNIAQKNKHDIALGTNETPVGLTSAALIMNSSFKIMTASSQTSPMSCSQVTQLNVNLGFEKTTIYMPTDLKKHTCAYHAVLGHEKKHVRTDKAFLKSIVPEIKRELSWAIRGLGTIRSGSQKYASDKISKTLNKKLHALGQKFATRRRSWHKRVDTPQEYKRVGRSCGGTLRDIVQEASKAWD